MKAAFSSITIAALLGCSPVAAGPAVAREAQVTARTDIAQGCGDLLARLGMKPAGVRYIGCTSFPNFQAAPVRASYDVAGRDAAAVEAYLVRAMGLNPLKRSCCQWDSAPAGFVDDRGGQFTVAMVSDETPVSRREDWGGIARFRVTVEMLTGEI